MNWQQVWGVLKWVLAALVAGFVGQFGKSLALFFMKRRRNRKEIEAASARNKDKITAILDEFGIPHVPVVENDSLMKVYRKAHSK